MPETSDAINVVSPPICGEPYLLTPGPLTTAVEVKQAMLKDWGSWDDDFRQMTQTLRSSIIDLLEDHKNAYECIPMQGSGTFVVEAMLGTLLPPDSHSLVLMNGAYGKRIAQTLERTKHRHSVIDKGDYLPPRGEEVAQAIANDPSISHVIVVHCETSSGILNPLEEIAEVAAKNGKQLLIDSMSAFGAIPLSCQRVPFTALVSSANKCVEGVPGFGFALIKRTALNGAEGNCHSLSLDLYEQWQNMERTGQWRYTPPTHVVAAFLEALKLHKKNGGVEGRLMRYTRNRDTLISGMRDLGFETLLDGKWLSPIIVTFLNPADVNFEFQAFYQQMKARGFIIYPGKLTDEDSFRIGCIGQIDADIMQKVVDAAADSLSALGVSNASPRLADA